MRAIAALLLALCASMPVQAQSKCDPTTLDGSIVTIGVRDDYVLKRPTVYGAAWFIAPDRLVTINSVADMMFLSSVPREILVRQKPLQSSTRKYWEQVHAHVAGVSDIFGAQRIYVLQLDKQIAQARPLPIDYHHVAHASIPVMSILYRNADPLSASGTTLPFLGRTEASQSIIPFKLFNHLGVSPDASSIGSPLCECNRSVIGIVAGVVNPQLHAADKSNGTMDYALALPELADRLRK
jgi:hypothetical protein